MQQAEQAIDDEIEKLKTLLVDANELQKVKNKVESYLVFSQTKAIDKAMNLAYFELLGDANRINTEIDNYLMVSPEQIKCLVINTIIKTNCSTLYYFAKKTAEIDNKN
jgi:predicted Zn-dependent peptidase